MDIKNVSQEELASEQQAIQELKEEEVRSKIIEEYGFDESTDSEKIDKLTKREIELGKKLSSAIGAKIKHRTEAQKLADELKSRGTTSEAKDDKKLSDEDIIAIARANVHEDDTQEVLEYARFKKIPFKEALKSDVIKTMLSTREEFRKSAEIANKGTSKRVTQKVTDESLLEDLSKGKIPEPNTEEAERVFWARRGGKR